MLQSNPFASDSPPPDLAAQYEASPASSCIYSPGDLVRFYWPPILGRIILAGGCYPIVLGIGGLFAQIYATFMGFGSMDAESFLRVITAAPLYAMFTGTMGTLWASIVAIFTVPIVHLVVWSLRLRTGLVSLGAFTGGLVGFVAILPLTFQLPGMVATTEAWYVLMMLAVGPGLATVLGQIGGAVGGRKAAKLANELSEQHRRLLAVRWRRESTRSPGEDAGITTESHESQFQFRIAHLLWLGVWLSLLLTLIRLAGIPYQFILPLLAGWLAYQAATLWVGWQLVRQLAPWWTGRRPFRRST